MTPEPPPEEHALVGQLQRIAEDLEAIRWLLAGIAVLLAGVLAVDVAGALR
jgi:hypothetical protein